MGAFVDLYELSILYGYADLDVLKLLVMDAGYLCNCIRIIHILERICIFKLHNDYILGFFNTYFMGEVL